MLPNERPTEPRTKIAPAMWQGLIRSIRLNDALTDVSLIGEFFAEVPAHAAEAYLHCMGLQSPSTCWSKQSVRFTARGYQRPVQLQRNDGCWCFGEPGRCDTWAILIGFMCFFTALDFTVALGRNVSGVETVAKSRR